MIKRKIDAEPAGKAMTLDELASFVQQALRDGAAGSETPVVRINFGGTIKSASVTVQSAAPASAP